MQEKMSLKPSRKEIVLSHVQGLVFLYSLFYFIAAIPTHIYPEGIWVGRIELLIWFFVWIVWSGYFVKLVDGSYGVLIA